MTIAQEMFRFFVVRETERTALNRIGSRLIRDARAPHSGSLLVTLYGPGGFEDKLAAAESYAKTAGFVTADDFEMLALGPAVDFFRQYLMTGIALTDLATGLAEKLPFMAALLDDPPSADVLEATARFLGRVWDSLYALTIIGGDRYVSTSYLADVLRVYQVLHLLWMCREQHRRAWPGGGFDDYDVLIDLGERRHRPASPRSTRSPAEGLPSLRRSDWCPRSHRRFERGETDSLLL